MLEYKNKLYILFKNEKEEKAFVVFAGDITTLITASDLSGEEKYHRLHHLFEHKFKAKLYHKFFIAIGLIIMYTMLREYYNAILDSKGELFADIFMSHFYLIALKQNQVPDQPIDFVACLFLSSVLPLFSCQLSINDVYQTVYNVLLEKYTDKFEHVIESILYTIAGIDIVFRRSMKLNPEDVFDAQKNSSLDEGKHIINQKKTLH